MSWKSLVLLFILSALVVPISNAALDIDATFKGRVLGASDTKRTLLVDRGTEQGLVLNQHAKISLPNGMVARAVVVKIAPSRSVWSVYRFFAKDSITAKTVYIFKIASPITLTADESKALGTLAVKVNRRAEAVPREPKSQQKQKKIKRSIIDATKVVSQYDNIDYSKLNDKGLNANKIDEDVDWRGVNGKKDAENFDASLDYSMLR